MNITLRPGKQSDYAFLWWLHGATMRTYVEAIWGWDEAAQRRLFQERFDPARIQILERDGEVIGYISVERNEEYLFLSAIEIAPQVQNRGIGSSLIRDLQDEAARRRIPLRLRVLQGNPARRLYERLGFVATGETETHITMSWQPQTMAASDRGEPR
ncbi:MAG: GNAT family N-acetyltransferase [Anaerolineae bacterium]